MKLFLSSLFCLTLAVSNGQGTLSSGKASGADTAFWQEYGESYPFDSSMTDKNVRGIALGAGKEILAATSTGVWQKPDSAANWAPVPMRDSDRGPAYAVLTDVTAKTWLGTWNGLYLFRQGIAQRIPGTEGPVSLLCESREGVYALGPNGVWLCSGSGVVKKNFQLARSLRSAVSDGKKGLWIGSDVGLYHATDAGTTRYVKNEELLSAYAKGVAMDDKGQVWVAGLGGVSILKNGVKQRVIRPQEGCPSVFASAVKKAPDGSMWVGTQVGTVRFYADGSHSLRFSRRWLLDDQVNDIVFDADGTAWIATAGGVSAIKKRKMTLSGKQDYFYDVLMKRHIREPWIAGQCRLSVPGDISTFKPDDDDNDGEYGGNYLAMESFRYAATKSEDAREKAGKSYAFLQQLEEVTGGDGYFARTIVPAGWTEKLHDGNDTFDTRQRAEELVKEPRAKVVETRWHYSADKKWLWKGDASSDEWCGHMMGYFFFYELVADEKQKVMVRHHVARLVDHLMAHGYNMMDADGTHTRWSVWSPASLNGDPEWGPDKSENAMELLAFLKLAFYMTGDQKYEEAYLRFIRQEHYLDHMADLTKQNPAWFVYYDVMMQSYLYPILIHCEKDPARRAWYQAHMDQWMSLRRADHNPQINFFYSYSRDRKEGLNASLDFLRDTPLDLINWNIDHSKREDVKMVRTPVLDDLQVDELPPASIRTTVRWDKNPWAAINGVPDIEREPVFWLLPYWMGRYLKMIPEN